MLIITGFCIPEKQTGETDGPSGALALGAALKKLGMEVWIGTDRYTLKALKAASIKVDMEAHVYNIEESIVAAGSMKDWLLYMDTLVFVERPGKAEDGRYYNMTGADISACTFDTDQIFIQAQALGVPVISIGDGGNEAGMGLICQEVKNHVINGVKICAVTKADYLITCGISNWGGYALAGGLQLLTQKKCLYTPEQEAEVIRTLVDHGAVDGVTKEQTYSIDGVEMEVYIETIRKIYEVVVE